ncbi:unnamed protein product [Angiostrongylus costaricensis]|uniref:Zinc transporter ZIP9 n=1 Tax=Angiostrongylus costaricensis TaxID=334426 RepID=A0A0R3PT68_ANGCS|nr:unnamed protein product [Angiostrongylus costaricensis]
MEGIALLTVLSCSMFLGSYFAGSIPMMFSMSEPRMRMVSIFGAGLLLGTALSVIIPEGVESLYSGVAGNLRHLRERNNRVKPEETLMNSKTEKEESPAIISRAFNRDVTSGILNGESALDPTGSDYSHNHIYSGAHQHIGYPLVFGFVFMLLVDQISSVTGSRNDRSGRNRMGISATIGLVVHAAADGVALGSTSTTNKSDVQLIVFIAIMLHKGPAAFGLVSFLLLEGIDSRSARKHLLVFACAAPFAAVLTFIILGMSSSESSTGMLMLFSAGTFLFVATVHVLPELDYSLVIDAQALATSGHSHSGKIYNYNYGVKLFKVWNS